VTRHARWLAVALLAALTWGCAPRGLIFSDVTFPLDIDLDATPAQPNWSESNVKALTIWVTAQWDSSAIADAARERGLTRIYFADMRVLTVLFYWEQRWAIVYGE